MIGCTRLNVLLMFPDQPMPEVDARKRGYCGMAIGQWTVSGFYRRGETEAAEQLLAGGQIRVVDIDRHGVISF